MTNKEAINTLNYLKDYYNDKNEDSYVGFHDDDNEAIDKAINALEQQPSEDCISREEIKEFINTMLTSNEVMGSIATNEGRWVEEKIYLHGVEILEGLSEYVNDLPSVKPKYTDEEIDKAQAVEQAYVEKMVELAVEEIKERYSDAIGKMKKAIDEMTEIHSDGEFYIKNVDAKWIISKYLCGAEIKEANDG